MKVIAVTGLKGGVGKTSAAVNLAALAADAGHSTVLWDLDPQGAATHCLAAPATAMAAPEAVDATDPGRVGEATSGGSGLRGLRRRGLAPMMRPVAPTGLSLIPARTAVHLERDLSAVRRPARRMARLLRSIEDRCDVAVLDCPPGMGVLVEAVASVADLLLVPVQPEPLSILALDRFVEFLETTGAAGTDRVLPFISRIDRRNAQHRRSERAMTERGGLAAASIPESSAVARISEDRMPTVVAAPASLAGVQYRELWAEVAGRTAL